MLYQMLRGYLLAVNLLGLALMGWDKLRAKTGGWRVPEKTLFAIALAGGSAGAIAGMFLFRHKTRHRQFRWGLPAILAVQLALAGFLLYQLWRV